MTAPFDEIYLRIAEFAQNLHTSETHAGVVIAELTEFAATVIPGAQSAGITTVKPHNTAVSTPAATNRWPILLDQIQQQHHQGPCLTAASDQVPIDINDLEHDRRWPKYRADVLAQTPIRSIMSFELAGTPHLMAALNVYADHPHAFDEHAHAIGRIFSTHTSLAWDAARSRDQFTQALASRDIIGQAKGLVMERFGIDALQAFAMLRKLSQDSNIPVAQIAERLVQVDHPLPADPHL